MASAVKPRVCVIGAGIAGLSAARRFKEENINFIVLEATGHIGGTWRYDDRVGTDENGYPILTSMYKNLRTNIPKVTMELPYYPMPEDFPSYPSWDLFYSYIKSYAKHFELEKHILFSHYVTSVKRVQNIWKVKHTHIPTGQEYEEDYEYVIVGIGHHNKPNYPNIPGEDLFKGTIIHSHDYREPDPYKNRRVLIIGSGPSGMDISLDIAEVSKTLVHSHHSNMYRKTPYPRHYIKKPDVKEFNETGAFFVDGTYEDVDDVIYCTGFQYDYPFLDDSSEIRITPHSVEPLYKYMVNIKQPTMIFFGLIVQVCVVIAIDAQASYTAALIKKKFTLPSQEEMQSEWQRHLDMLRSSGRPLSHLHLVAEKEDEYYAELSKEAGIERVPPVMHKIRNMDIASKVENLYTYRDYAYTVIDKENFVRQYEPHVNSTRYRYTEP